jgi:hypothetical protein
MAERTDIVNPLMPSAAVEFPPGLLDPEIRHFASDYSRVVLLITGAVGQAVVAQTQVRGHPW